ncbi:alanine racemase [Variovorax sp. 3319]|nr:alanine racemase [Variovorax sp. 3319]
MPTLSTLDDVARWDSASRGELQVFLKVECGGLRAGCPPSQIVALARAIIESRHLRLAGIYGHLLAYGLEDPMYAKAQLSSFKQSLGLLDADGLGVPLRMFSSSETLLAEPEADFTGIEPGRLILGMSFPAIPDRDREWRNALVGIKSRLVMVKSIAEEDGVLYAPYFKIRADMKVGLIPLGWSDGYPRALPKLAQVLVGGRRVAVLGPVHAELLRIDLTDLPDAQVGDEVVLLGAQGDQQITLTELTTQWCVSEIDVYTSIVKKLPKAYIN